MYSYFLVPAKVNRAVVVIDTNLHQAVNINLHLHHPIINHRIQAVININLHLLNILQVLVNIILLATVIGNALVKMINVVAAAVQRNISKLVFYLNK